MFNVTWGDVPLREWQEVWELEVMFFFIEISIQFISVKHLSLTIDKFVKLGCF